MGAPVDPQFVEHLVDPPDPVATSEYFESLRGA
jgi:hypothetical protein